MSFVCFSTGSTVYITFEHIIEELYHPATEHGNDLTGKKTQGINIAVDQIMQNDIKVFRTCFIGAIYV